MYVISSFTYCTHLELAIGNLESKGIKRDKIFAVPLDKRDEKRKLFDTINQSDGISLFDLSIILGTFFMLLGGIYGFLLKWGPILWGLIGLVFGAIIGFIIDIFPKGRKRSKNKVKDKTTEVFLMVECEKSQVEMIEKILWDNMAIGIAKVEKPVNTKR